MHTSAQGCLLKPDQFLQTAFFFFYCQTVAIWYKSFEMLLGFQKHNKSKFQRSE